ncbi:hypothetical protein K1719_030050 [Acacia pycnantha]|nr:hypothetical protein K1719_030050 [Acacia pycnantha]
MKLEKTVLIIPLLEGRIRNLTGLNVNLVVNAQKSVDSFKLMDQVRLGINKFCAGLSDEIRSGNLERPRRNFKAKGWFVKENQVVGKSIMEEYEKDSPEEVESGYKAIVPYVQKEIISEVAEKLKGIQLKRNAGDDLVAENVKRRKIGEWPDNSDDQVKERLDRCVANVDFREDFGKALVFHVEPFGSDYHLLLLDCCYDELMRSPKRFKFEAMERRLTKAKKLRIEEIIGKIEELWDREEMYWWQRARLNWTKFGDKNARFFHSTVIQRSARNKLLRLRYYKASMTHNEEEVLKYVRRVISDEDNQISILPVDEEEIKREVFQIGANKAPGPDMVFQNLAREELKPIPLPQCELDAEGDSGGGIYYGFGP